ncbi:MAG: hypothetical protein PHG94_05590 [Syntrophomonas sp.]|uniref:YkvI family membrane protein n=1 Tax=Syntrophomonas sp. TaxID=2053627 RepID=UPI002606074F|nr:hypothetical protein [Syntrophomonas sp.]MDD2510583.1 hypothetical protein [Syntrophomonas sp.]MDD4626296.1 hypothetical protein [Syntrophomonas sp.]
MGYLGAVIGAGFASGQEIIQFFVVYGSDGFKGTLLATFAFAFCGGMLLYLARRYHVSNYQDMLAQLMGNKCGKLIDWLLAVFLFLGISTMLSASGAVFEEHLYLPKSLGILLTYLMVIFFLFSGKKGLITSFNILVPLKILFLLIVTSYAAFFLQNQALESYSAYPSPADSRFWVISSILYVAYNFSLAMVVLSEYQSLGNCREGIAGAAWGGLILGILLILTYLSLGNFLPMVMHYEVPMLYLAGKISPQVKQLYILILWIGILTTAIANAYGFTQRVADLFALSFRACLLLCMTLSLPLAMQNFSTLVGKIYPLFGLLGIIIISVLLFQSIKDMALLLYYNIKQ